MKKYEEIRENTLVFHSFILLLEFIISLFYPTKNVKSSLMLFVFNYVCIQFVLKQL